MVEKDQEIREKNQIVFIKNKNMNRRDIFIPKDEMDKVSQRVFEEIKRARLYFLFRL